MSDSFTPSESCSEPESAESSHEEESLSSSGLQVLPLSSVDLSGNPPGVSSRNFELLRVLGTGAYGKVFLVRKRGGCDNGKLYAMKVLKKASVVRRSKTAEHTMTERAVLEAIRSSPFLVHMHYAFQTDSKLHLVLDYISGGDLFTHLQERSSFDDDAVRFYAAEIALALHHLHELGIVYRDLKLENVMLDSDGHIVLTDFGLSKEFVPGEQDHRTYSYCGTLEYMAPEVLLAEQSSGVGYDQVCDWWSLGVLTVELLSGTSPFACSNSRSAVAHRIVHEEPALPAELSRVSRHFVLALLHKKPEERLGIGGVHELQRHPFLSCLDWTKLQKRVLDPPFRPFLQHELDTSNFAKEFTEMAPEDSPAPAGQRPFVGYSYVEPTVLGGRTVPVRPGEPPADSAFLRGYDLFGALGEGAFSVVRRCVSKDTGEELAVKVVSNKVDCTREIALLRLCQGHPNVVKLVDVLEDELHHYMVMEYLSGGELLHAIRHRQRFSEREAALVLRRLVSAVRFLHARDVVHRDLKPENLLLANDELSSVCVCDFGLARLLQGQPLQTPCYSLPYAAPEVLRHRDYDQTCDVWGLGVILHMMLSGKTPARRADDAVELALNGDEWLCVSESAKELVRAMLNSEPSRRPALDAVARNEWLRGTAVPSTPLMSPGALSSTFIQTIRTRKFHLRAVQEAPLAKRRRQGSTRTGSDGQDPQ